MGWTTGRYCFDFQQGKGIFLFCKATDAVWSQNTPLLNEHRMLFSQGEVAGRETDRSPRSIDEIKNEWRAQEHVYLYVTLVTL